MRALRGRHRNGVAQQRRPDAPPLPRRGGSKLAEPGHPITTSKQRDNGHELLALERAKMLPLVVVGQLYVVERLPRPKHGVAQGVGLGGSYGLNKHCFWRKESSPHPLVPNSLVRLASPK